MWKKDCEEQSFLNGKQSELCGRKQREMEFQ